MFETVSEPEEETEEHARQEAARQREVKRKALPPDEEIAGEAAQPVDVRRHEEHNPEDRHDDPEEDERSAQRLQLRTHEPQACWTLD